MLKKKKKQKKESPVLEYLRKQRELEHEEILEREKADEEGFRKLEKK